MGIVRDGGPCQVPGQNPHRSLVRHAQEGHFLGDQAGAGGGWSVERVLHQCKEALKASLTGGMLFEELGFRYVGPVDGHDLPTLVEYLRMVKDIKGPVLLHVFTEKGMASSPPVPIR